MSVRLIKIINWSLLVIVLIGIPAISSVRVGSLRLTDLSVSQLMTLWGLGVAAGVNGVASIWLAKGAKVRRAFRAWVFIHVVLFAFCWLVFAGHVHFDWLKEFLLWLRDQFKSIA